MADMQKDACHLGENGVEVYPSKRCTSSRSASHGKRPSPPPKVACGTAALLLPAAVRLFQEKPAAPPPAAGFFVCAVIARPGVTKAATDHCFRRDLEHVAPAVDGTDEASILCRNHPSGKWQGSNTGHGRKDHRQARKIGRADAGVLCHEAQERRGKEEHDE